MQKSPHIKYLRTWPPESAQKPPKSVKNPDTHTSVSWHAKCRVFGGNPWLSEVPHPADLPRAGTKCKVSWAHLETRWWQAPNRGSPLTKEQVWPPNRVHRHCLLQQSWTGSANNPTSYRKIQTVVKNELETSAQRRMDCHSGARAKVHRSCILSACTRTTRCKQILC